MKNFSVVLHVASAVCVALIANSISAIWARQESKISIWLLAVLLISPLVFITFGLVTAKIGVTISSGVIDSLLTLGTICVGLFLFQEWNKVSFLQYIGMLLAVGGVFLMLFFPKTAT